MLISRAYDVSKLIRWELNLVFVVPFEYLFVRLVFV